jgi:hypothetical protein
VKKEERVRGQRETWVSVFSDAGWRDEDGEWHASSPFTATEHQIALTLATFMSPNGDSCYPSIPRLAVGSGRANSTVRECLDRLVEWGFLQRRQRRGRGNSNEYVAEIPEYFDWLGSSEENRRRAAVFAGGHEQLEVGPVVKPVSGSPEVGVEKTAGERRFSDHADEGKNRRSGARKPPEGLAKTAGERPQLDQDRSKIKNPLAPSELGEGEEASNFELRLALTAVLVEQFASGKLTKSERASWEHAVAQLADVDATPDEVRDRCAAYRTIFPTAALTPIALVRHWNLLGARATIAQPDPETSLDGWVEKTGWRLAPEDASVMLEDTGFSAKRIDAALRRAAELAEQYAAGEQATRQAIEDAA